jgi:hypothetical protein
VPALIGQLSLYITIDLLATDLVMKKEEEGLTTKRPTTLVSVLDQLRTPMTRSVCTHRTIERIVIYKANDELHRILYVCTECGYKSSKVLNENKTNIQLT